MDALNKALIGALSLNARTSIATLARRLGVARTTVQARLERLERTGVIAGYSLKLGQDIRQNQIRATVLVQVEPRATAGVLQRLNGFSEVETVHTTSGRFDMILQLSAGNTKELDDILDQIGEIKGVQSSESLILLSTKIDRGF